MCVAISNLSLVVLIGPSGSGKSTFARGHFRPTEVLSSDSCRSMVSDDENDQAVTKDAFEVLRFVAGKRLALGRLTVIDATNVQGVQRQVGGPRVRSAAAPRPPLRVDPAGVPGLGRGPRRAVRLRRPVPAGRASR